MAKLATGERAPQFALPGPDGTTYRLAEALARGPVVLVFYVLDNTPG